ncbi:MAG: type II toxin-antitoxin system death-on-curing family toxin [Candidatus Omnitrophota bacterium]
MKRKTKKTKFSVREEGAVYRPSAPVFLTHDEVLKLHVRQIELFGGTDGIRDMALLHSALAQPEASFGGHWLHNDIFEMAAAYAYHICQNHPFFDGNKRTALDAALMFLGTNGILFKDPKEIFIGVMLSVARGKMGKKELAQIFRDLPRE